MGLESGTYVEDLVVTNPTSGDLRSVGDDHLRLIKKVLKNTFPGADGVLLTKTPTELVVNEVGADVNLRVEVQGNVNGLVVDAGTGFLGVGTTPSFPIHVKAAAQTVARIEDATDDNGIGPQLQLHRSRAGGQATAGDALGRVNFLGENSAGVITTYAEINSFIDTSTISIEDGRLSIAVSVGGTLVNFLRMAGQSPQPELVLNEAGNDIDIRMEGVGEPNALFVQGNTGRVAIGFTDPDGPLSIGGSAPILYFQPSGLSGRSRLQTTGATFRVAVDPDDLDSSSKFEVSVDGDVGLTIDNNFNFRPGGDGQGGVLDSAATNGFLYLPAVNGAPTGTPTAFTGFGNITVSPVTGRLYYFTGAAWFSVTGVAV